MNDSVDATVATKPAGRVLAWTALVVALGASVAANVASALPSLGPRLTASVAPVLVVIAAALLERVSLSLARRWQRLTWAGVLSFIVAGAFVTSYEHQRSLLLRYGNPPLSATLLPLAIDALIIMASVALSLIATQTRAWRVAKPTAPTGVSPPPAANGHRVPLMGGRPVISAPPSIVPMASTAAPRRSRAATGNLADLRGAFYAGERPADAAVRLGVSKRTVERAYASLRKQEPTDRSETS